MYFDVFRGKGLGRFNSRGITIPCPVNTCVLVPHQIFEAKKKVAQYKLFPEGMRLHPGRERMAEYRPLPSFPEPRAVLRARGFDEQGNLSTLVVASYNPRRYRDDKNPAKDAIKQMVGEAEKAVFLGEKRTDECVTLAAAFYKTCSFPTLLNPPFL